MLLPSGPATRSYPYSGMRFLQGFRDSLDAQVHRSGLRPRQRTGCRPLGIFARQREAGSCSLRFHRGSRRCSRGCEGRGPRQSRPFPRTCSHQATPPGRPRPREGGVTLAPRLRRCFLGFFPRPSGLSMPAAPNRTREMASTSTGSQREPRIVAAVPFMSRPSVFLALQILKKSFGLQTGIELQRLLQIGPHLLERIRSIAPSVPALKLAGQRPAPPVLAGRFLVHPRLGGGQGESIFFLHQLHEPPHLGIGDHLTSMAYNGLDLVYHTTTETEL